MSLFLVCLLACCHHYFCVVCCHCIFLVHFSRGLFENIPQHFKVVRYNSLIASADDLPSCLRVTGHDADNHEIMAIDHTTLPIYTVQFRNIFIIICTFIASRSQSYGPWVTLYILYGSIVHGTLPFILYICMLVFAFVCRSWIYLYRVRWAIVT